MRIAFLAMSGVRAHDPELTALGLTLPGFVERNKVIASLPSLSLLTLAALTPDDIEVSYHEVPDLAAADDLPMDVDLAAVSTYSAQASEGYAVARRYRDRGVPVVMGGLHVTALPDEARAHGAIPVTGEGELSWPRVVEDLRRGRLAPEYAPPAGEQYDLAEAPVPRYDLLDVTRYNRLTVQTSRGCSHRCEFCASSVLIAPRYRVKPVARVLEEIRRIRSIWPDPFLEFADDNSFVNHEHARALCRALLGEGLRWFTETDLSIAHDPELLELMRASGCRQVLIGLESPLPDGLAGLELNSDWKRRRQPEYLEAVRTIQSHGITVNGCFVLGLDGQDETIFDAVHDFVERSGLYEVQITVLTAFPGTPLHARLKREGRILENGAWDLCTLFDVNHVPTGMSPERLRQGLVDLGRRLYDGAATEARRKRFHREWARMRRAARGTGPGGPA
jgi:radical SAM superfamily enzyme YgiQ (UPF0313 family)